MLEIRIEKLDIFPPLRKKKKKITAQIFQRAAASGT